MMNNKINAILVGRDENTVSVIQETTKGLSWLELNSHIASNGHADLLKGLDDLPKILIVDLSTIWREEIEALAKLNNLDPDKRPHIIVIGKENNTEIMRAVMKIGARDYFPYPINAKDFNETLLSISKENAQKDQSGHAKVITVLNGKGGSGATMIASNLSYILAEKYNKRVALFDFHNVITSLPLYFDVDIQHTINDALQNINALDEVALQGAMEKLSDNLFILSSRHDKLEQGVKISSDIANRLLKLSSNTFDYIVIDIPVSISSTASTILNSSDEIFLVTQQSIPHMSETSLIYKAIVKQFAIEQKKINIILNRYESNGAIRIEDIKESMSESVITVPSDYKTVATSLNVGTPLYKAAKRAKVTQSLVDICDNLLLPDSNKKGHRSKWTQPLAGIFQS